MTDRPRLDQRTDVLPADRLRNLIDRACRHLTPQEANALRGAAAGTMRNATAAVAELHQRLALAEAERDQHAAQLTAARKLITETTDAASISDYEIGKHDLAQAIHTALAAPGPEDTSPTRWLHIAITNSDEYTANRSALSLRDWLHAEFSDGIAMRITTNAREQATASEGSAPC